MNLLIAAVATFAACLVLVPAIFWLLRFFGVYAIVEERTCNVFVLFGKVVAILDEPGLHILLFKLGLQAPIVSWLGRLYVLDMRIDQQYLRSQPVNSEEGAPMGIGIWASSWVLGLPANGKQHRRRQARFRHSRGWRLLTHRHTPFRSDVQITIEEITLPGSSGIYAGPMVH